MSWDPILPHRAIFICDENCSSSCEGCKEVRNGIKYTTDVVHAKNGPVVNFTEWKTRFKIEQLKDTLLYYMEIPEGEKVRMLLEEKSES